MEKPWGLPPIPGFVGDYSGGHRFIHSSLHLLPSIPVVPRHNILTLLVPLSLCVLKLHSSLPLVLYLPSNSYFSPWTSKSPQRVFATSIPDYVAQTLFPNLLPSLYFPCSSFRSCCRIRYFPSPYCPSTSRRDRQTAPLLSLALAPLWPRDAANR